MFTAFSALTYFTGYANGMEQSQSIKKITVQLDGAQSVPAVETAAKGSAKLSVDLQTGAISGELGIQDISATKAHIHRGGTGENGQVMATFEPAGAQKLAIPQAKALSNDDLTLLLKEDTCRQVHNQDFPKRELRDQIRF